MTSRRIAAIVSIFAALATLITAVVAAVVLFPAGLAVLGCAALALVAAWYGVARRGAAHVVGLTVAVLALVGAILLIVTDGGLPYLVLIIVGIGVGHLAARAAFRVHVRRPPASRPERPIVLINPRSGNGKAAKYSLADQARARGIEAIEMRPDEKLETLVREGIARGADAVAMAGGDGSQAIVAEIAAEHDLPYACIPSGTRNHFALDLGVDRTDVVGALDAFVDGAEFKADLGEVNGRVFVNNVSFGLYAEAVRRADYRSKKIRTLLNTAPDILDPDGEGLHLRWTEPDGQEHRSAAVLLVSNNRYRLGWAVGAGTRPRIDEGVLGVAVVGPPPGRESGTPPLSPRPWREWVTPEFEVRSDDRVPVGIDGESVVLDPPVRFRTRHRVLRVRVARQHPGAAPSAMQPEGIGEGFRALLRLAAGRPVATPRRSRVSTREP
jgi:diacylglycerol kinase family enzyme